MLNEKFILFRIHRFRDKSAYAKLYERYHKNILDFASFKMPRKQDAEEITSEVFLRGWEYATSNRVDNIKALFYRIARNQIADFYRKRKAEDSLDELADIAEDQEIEERIDLSESANKLIAKIRALKGDMSEVCVMHYVNELSVKEIADILDKSPNNVRVILHRAKTALNK